MKAPSQQPKRERDRERGVALILVLGFMAVTAVMIMHVATSTEVANIEAKVLTERAHLKFEAESACARAFWLTLMYRNRHPVGTLGVASTNPTEDEEDEVWRADSSIRSWDGDGFRVSVQVGDADVGLDFSGPNPEARLRSLPAYRADDVNVQEIFDEFLDELADYVDRDDLTHLHGSEVAEYGADGEPDLPRNAPLEFREEALWLDAAAAFLTGGIEQKGSPPDLASIRIIPPRGGSFKRGLRPSFFSASPNLIRQLTGLTDLDLTTVLRARSNWQTARIPLDQSLDPALYARLRARFSFIESGIYSVRAVARHGDIQRAVRLVRDGRVSGLRFQVTRPWITNWEKVFP